MNDKTYYGTKKLKAREMTLGDYNMLRGWVIPADEKPETPGYLVEYLDGSPGNHPQFRGYILWSPKAVFEDAYQPADAMSFGHAVKALKEGFRGARALGGAARGCFCSS